MEEPSQEFLQVGFCTLYEGKPLTAAALIAPGDRLSLEFADGRVDATAGDQPMTAPRKAPKPRPASSDDQGVLL